MRKKPKICFICNTGGHLEQIKQLFMVADRYEHYYVIPSSKSTKNFKEKKYLVNSFSRSNKLLFPVEFICTSIIQLIIYLFERPNVVITTGAGVAYPTCRIAKFFGSKVIYIESFARMKSLNKTGKMLYPFADLFVVQWKELLTVVPKAVYGGWIY